LGSGSGVGGRGPSANGSRSASAKGKRNANGDGPRPEAEEEEQNVRIEGEKSADEDEENAYAEEMDVDLTTNANNHWAGGIMMASLRNKNKKKGFFRQAMMRGLSVPEGLGKIVFESDSSAVSGPSKSASASVSTSGVSAFTTQQQNAASAEGSTKPKPRFIPPSELQEKGLLPRNMVVSSFHVEEGTSDRTYYQDQDEQLGAGGTRKKQKNRGKGKGAAGEGWQGGAASPTEQRPRLIPPSELQEKGLLPRNMVVTSVDVGEGMRDRAGKRKKQKTRGKGKGKQEEEGEGGYGGYEYEDPDQFVDAEEEVVTLVYDGGVDGYEDDPHVGKLKKKSEKTTVNWEKAEIGWNNYPVLEERGQVVGGGVLGWKVSEPSISTFASISDFVHSFILLIGSITQPIDPYTGDHALASSCSLNIG
jgi:hypothetical protein